MKQFFQLAILGALIGLSTSYMIITIDLLVNPTYTLDGNELFLEFRLAIILGIGCGITSLIFYMERWSIVVKLIIHYFIILALVLICGAFGEWYENPVEKPGEFFLFFAVQLTIYLAIFVLIYWTSYQEVKNINEKLKRRSKENHQPTIKLRE
ncbi:DUF3021 domain-containing protein [Viridibacillus sp. NPDC096237]|uniref:DUF3021 domain-containing protein n=1 Tax=Viridibacillus sp. NPDC096237 TaxID=3390721 RepID=UPI003D02183F